MRELQPLLTHTPSAAAPAPCEKPVPSRQQLAPTQRAANKETHSAAATTTEGATAPYPGAGAGLRCAFSAFLAAAAACCSRLSLAACSRAAAFCASSTSGGRCLFFSFLSDLGSTKCVRMICVWFGVEDWVEERIRRWDRRRDDAGQIYGRGAAYGLLLCPGRPAPATTRPNRPEQRPATNPAFAVLRRSGEFGYAAWAVVARPAGVAGQAGAL